MKLPKIKDELLDRLGENKQHYKTDLPIWSDRMTVKENIGFNSPVPVSPCGKRNYSVEIGRTSNKVPYRFLIVRNLRVVDICEDPLPESPVYAMNGEPTGHAEIFVSESSQVPKYSPSWVYTVKTPEAPKTPKKSKDHTHTHTLRLRTNFSVKLTLPSDLTEEEAERLSKWLSALPCSS